MTTNGSAALALYLADAARGRNRFVNFLAVGAVNAAFGYAVFVLCLWLGAHFSVAAAVATVLGTLFNFKTTGLLVFGSRNNALIFRFIAVYVVVYCANVAGIWAIVHLGAEPYLAGLLMLLPLALLSFSLNSRFVFKDA